MHINERRALLFPIAWELSAAKVTKSYSRRYPHLNDFTGRLNFRYKTYNLKTKQKTYAKFPIQIWGKSAQVFLSYDRTNKQTGKPR